MGNCLKVSFSILEDLELRPYSLKAASCRIETDSWGTCVAGYYSFDCMDISTNILLGFSLSDRQVS